MVGVPDLLWWELGPSWRMTCPIFKALSLGIPRAHTNQLRPPANSRGVVSWSDELQASIAAQLATQRAISARAHCWPLPGNRS